MASPFDLEQFVVQPTYEQLINIRKTEWRAIADHFNISVPSQATKEVIKNVVIEELVNQDILPREAEYTLIPIGFSPAPDRPGVVPPPVSHPPDEVSAGSDALAWERLKLERLRLEYEHQHPLKELEIKELEARGNQSLKERELSKFKPTKATGLLPSFDESDVDSYFRSFERLADKHNWPEDQWVTILVPKLVGKALRVFHSLNQPDD